MYVSYKRNISQKQINKTHKIHNFSLAINKTSFNEISFYKEWKIKTYINCKDILQYFLTRYVFCY